MYIPSNLKGGNLLVIYLLVMYITGNLKGGNPPNALLESNTIKDRLAAKTK